MRTALAPSIEGLPFTVVDAFTTEPFRGNPAAVMIFASSDDPALAGEYPVKDELLQAMAMQFNIAETAFLVPTSEHASEAEWSGKSKSFRLRWFSPLQEIRLCGHATLASAFTLFESFARHNLDVGELSFHTTWSGTITAKRAEDSRVEIELPAGTPVLAPKCLRDSVTDAVLRSSRSLSRGDIVTVLREKLHPAFNEYAVVVLDPSINLRNLQVKPAELTTLDPYRMIVFTNAKPTVSPASGQDQIGYYIRAFSPLWGVPEDPVCGSANCLVARYWAEHFDLEGPVEMASSQVSKRSGELGVTWDRARSEVRLRGFARISVRGEISI